MREREKSEKWCRENPFYISTRHQKCSRATPTLVSPSLCDMYSH